MITDHVDVKTPDGLADSLLTRPDTSDKLPGVIVLTDIFGIRPAYEEMAQRIADRGYVVLTPNIFYRTRKPPIFDFEVNWEEERTMNRMKAIRTPLTDDASDRDGSAYVDFLASQTFVSKGPMGVVGFCLTGKHALRLAAKRPDRIRAAASFHGGGLYTAEAGSPHLLLPHVKGSLYFGHAENDRSMNAESIEHLESALDAWGGKFQSETYPAGHGWMISGRPVYNEQQAERGFAKLMSLFDENLKATVGAR